MEQNEIPLGFGFALAQHPVAMKHFCSLPEERQAQILQRACRASSRAEMHALVDELTFE